MCVHHTWMDACTYICVHIWSTVSSLIALHLLSFETGSQDGLQLLNSTAKDDLAVLILLPLLSEHWHYRNGPPCLTYVVLGISPGLHAHWPGSLSTELRLQHPTLRLLNSMYLLCVHVYLTHGQCSLSRMWVLGIEFGPWCCAASTLQSTSLSWGKALRRARAPPCTV